MTIKIVTDTACDISKEDAKKLGITLVPLYVRFGEEVYRDGVDIENDDFYKKLETSKVQPFTSSPSPGDFIKTYQEVAKDTDQIVSIHVTRKHSSTIDSARLGKEAIEQKGGCQIEVVDSMGVTMWQGLVAISAAKAAAGGCSIQQVKDRIQETISQLHGIGLLNTLRFIIKGGRLRDTFFNKAEMLIGAKPLITLREGEIRPLGLARNWNKGLDRIQEFIRSVPFPQNVAIVHNTIPQEAQTLINNLKEMAPTIVPKLCSLGPVLSAHSGPGAMLAVVQQGKA
jgi:DegV family protein with EDD domain